VIVLVVLILVIGIIAVRDVMVMSRKAHHHGRPSPIRKFRKSDHK